MIERNKFDNEIRDLALRHAPQQLAKCGEIVTAHWGGWKHPHKVKITRVAVEISSIDISIRRRKELGLTGWLIVQHEYFGRRLKSNGKLAGKLNTGAGFLLTGFTTDNGKKYERIPSGFNHAGLSFEFEEEVSQYEYHYSVDDLSLEENIDWKKYHSIQEYHQKKVKLREDALSTIPDYDKLNWLIVDWLGTTRSGVHQVLLALPFRFDFSAINIKDYLSKVGVKFDEENRIIISSLRRIDEQNND